MRPRLQVVFLFVVSLALPARAEDPSPVGESAFGEEIVVKGRRKPPIDSLEVREVRETPARDLGEALAPMPGMDKVRKGGIANDIVLRGLKRDDIAVTIDGAKVHGACPSRMDPPSFHLDYAEVDRVEVKKGPLDVSSPGGLGGAVDVRTRRAHPGFGTEVNVGGASASALESSATASFGGERYEALVGGALKRGGPFRSGNGENFTLAVPATTATGAPNGARFRDTSDDQTAYDVRSAFAKAGFAVAAEQRVEVSYTRQSAVDALYPYLRMDGITDDTDRAAATYAIGSVGPFSRGLVQAYYSRVEHDMTDARRCSSAANVATCDGALPREYSMRTLGRSSVWGGKGEVALRSAMDWTLGADVYARNWNNTTTRAMRMQPGLPFVDEASVPDVTIVDAGAYVEARRKVLPDLRAVAGVRVDVAHTGAAEDRTALYRVFFPGADLALRRTDVLVSGNVQAEYDVVRGLAAFAAYGHGTRVPDPQERYFALSGMMGAADWVGFPDLRPARNDEVDLGARWTPPGVLLRVHAFHSWLGDYIALSSVSVPSGAGTRNAKTYENVDARTYGYEASARVALPLQLYATASAAYTRGTNDTRDVPLAEIPPFKAAASLRYDTGLLFAEVEEAFAASQDHVDAAVGEQPTPGYWVASVRAGAEWRGVKLFAGMRNVFDRQYYEHLAYLRDPFATGNRVPEPGRTLYANAQYAF